MLFLETMRHADTLRRFAHSAAERGKPIIAYKLGRSATARELAVSHTGALAGEDDVADQFLKSCGIARVDTLEGLIEGLPLLSRVPVAARGGRKRVGVVTTTAGARPWWSIRSRAAALTIEPASADTLARLAAAGVEVKPARLVDLTIAGARYQTMKAALDILTTAPEFDLVLAAIGSSARSQPETTVRPIIDSAGAARPLAAFLVPDATAGVGVCSAARACRISARRKHAPTPLPQRYRGNRRGRCLRAPLQRPQAAGRFSTSSQPVRCSTASASHARRRLRSRWASPRVPPLPFAYPVAVKVLCAEIAHKTDVGGVALGVADGDALLAAIRKIASDRRRTKPWRARRPRAGAAHGVRPRRGPVGLSRRSRRWSADHGGGRRRAHRDRA